MRFKHVVATSWQSLTSNKTRATLTMLGIVIGITSLIVIMSLGKAANIAILSQVQGIGSKSFIIAPGRDAPGPADFSALFLDSLKERELLALQEKKNVPTLLDISPDILVPGSVSAGNETYGATVVGTGISFPGILDIYPDQGRFFDQHEVDTFQRVAVIGHKVERELFANESGHNKKIKIKGQNFQVIGVFKSLGTIAFFNVDDGVLIPYSSAQKYLTGTDYYNELFARADSERNIERTVRDITLTLRELHGITDPDKDDFHIHTQADLQKSVGQITSILTLLLSGIAAISLIVGGIGIMNIMYVSVKERTREIGIRKALGATRSDILRQFLFEAVLLTLVGGIVGMVLGLGISSLSLWGISSFSGLSLPWVISESSLLLGVGTSAAIGLSFGIFPARNAAMLPPMSALRYE